MAVQLLLPDELIVQILSILPAKSLLRCQLVCKSWLYLINSTKFKLMHVHNFNQLNPRYFVRRLDQFAGEELFRVHLDDEAFTFDHGTQIEFPFESSRVNLCFRIIGCCNGVVCLCDEDDDPYEDESSLDGIILWNPSIRRKLTLPLPMFYSLGFEDPFAVLGFGYESISDDYKVASLIYDTSSPSTRPKVEVYSVKTGIWREVMFPDDVLCYFTFPNWLQVFFNGAVHWTAFHPKPGASRYSIMTFDITTELFGEIQFPEFLAKEFLRVFVVGESLAVVHSSDATWDRVDSGSTYKVWVMKEYKNQATWTMVYHVQNADVNLRKPLRLRNDGDLIAELENRDMIMFNHNEGSYVNVFGDCVHEDFDCRTYVNKYQESLALLDVGDSVPNEEAMEALMIEKQESGHGVDTVARQE